MGSGRMLVFDNDSGVVRVDGSEGIDGNGMAFAAAAVVAIATGAGAPAMTGTGAGATAVGAAGPRAPA